MSQCLRCGKPCETISVFCETCRPLLRSQLWQAAGDSPRGTASVPTPEASIAVSPVIAMPSENGGVNSDGRPEELPSRINLPSPLQAITGPHPVVDFGHLPHLPQTPPPPSPFSPETEQGEQGEAIAPTGNLGSVVDEALRRLKEAAQRIAAVEQSHRRVPRASRLSPLRDISADIQRQSTPLPRLSKEAEGAKVKEVTSKRSKDQGHPIPDLWPWLQEDADTDESDQWVERSDPLIARHFPSSAEAKRIEEEDLRRAIAEGLVTLPIAPQPQAEPLTSLAQAVKNKPVSSRQRRMRKAFAIFAILAVAFLVVDSLLLAFVFTHPHRSLPLLSGPPSLTLSANAASVGQTIMLHIRNFSSDTQVFLSHDIQETVQLTTGSPLVKLGANGSADVTMLVDNAWNAGFHTIEAEGVTTRYTASAMLQISGAGPTAPSQLLIDSSPLDLGADSQGANTIRPFVLNNSGGGSISWSASSDRPWLLVSPTQGVFSAPQTTIAVAGERANLKPGDYEGTITFSSNVGPPQKLRVKMSVRSLPANVGAVLEITPPVLSFTALDGGSNPVGQALMVSNPGSQPLHWSLVGKNSISQAAQNSLLNALAPGAGWLSTSQTSGVVVPHGTSLIYVVVNSRSLLPGVYTGGLVFTGSQGTYNSPQNVNISLTVQTGCGLTLNSGFMSFTAVSGQGNPGTRSLGLSATASCSGVINWKAVSAANWLTVTPASGQLRASVNTVTAIGVNATILKPGTYVSNISFIAGQNTQTMMVRLIVQPPPRPSAPVMGAAPLTLNFNTTQGMADPPGQVVTITNTGKGQLNWRTTVNTFVSSWIGAIPSGGSIAPGQTGQVTINISTANLAPTTYVGQVTLIGTDAKGAIAPGSPQTITVNLLVLPPCILHQPSLSSVAFSATQGTSDPDSQSVVLTASGNCGWPLSWQTSVENSPGWLKLTPASGPLVASGQPTSITFAASIAGLTANTYTTKVTITATDGSNRPIQGNSQTILVTLNVLQPCSLQVDTTNLTFSAAQGQPAPSAQSFALSESGNCARPVSWSASASTGNNNWLVLSQPSSGTDSGTVQVGVNSQNMAPGTYTGTITLTAFGSGGALVQGSPQTVNVTLTITGYTLSGIALACSDSSCSSTKALSGASLDLVNNSTNQTFKTVADGLGAYSFTNLALGSYTVTVTGSDGTYSYSNTVTLNVSGNQANFSINVYPK